MGASKSILAQAKSETHKNLQARKKQQQVTANEDSEDWTFILIFVSILT